MNARPQFAAAIGMLAAGALALTGCSAANPATAESDGLTIVTTTTQVTDFVTAITAGTGATVTSLLQPGESAHSFEATPADLVAVGEADLVIASGYGLESWLDDVLVAAGYDAAPLEAADGFDPEILHEGAGHAAATGDEAKSVRAHDHDDEAHDDDTHDDAGHDDHDHGDHDHGDVDPHVWSAPLGAAYMVDTITEGLVAADEAYADVYRENSAAYVEQLEALDLWIGQNIAQVAEDERLIVTNHHALTYYTDSYHVTLVGSIMPSWDDNAEPSARELDALIAAIKESGVTAVFSETQISAATAEKIASEAGVAVYSGENALSTDALGEPDSSTATYIGATVHNTNLLLDSWGAVPTELPAELKGA